MKARASTWILFITIGIAVFLSSYIEYIFINPLQWLRVIGTMIIVFFYVVGLFTFLVWFQGKTTLSYRWGFALWNLMLMMVASFLRFFGDMFAAFFAFLSQ